MNELYGKSNPKPTQVATLTSQGETYIMQNDGYIIGTSSTPDAYTAMLYLDENAIALCPGDTSLTFKVSVYVTKGTLVKTRSDHGAYNLIVCEFK